MERAYALHYHEVDLRSAYRAAVTVLLVPSGHGGSGRYHRIACDQVLHSAGDGAVVVSSLTVAGLSLCLDRAMTRRRRTPSRTA